VINPDDTNNTRRRRTRAENKGASIRAERRDRQTQIDLTAMGHSRPRQHDKRPLPDDDQPCPF